MPRLVQPLPQGPLALIGDVHGELEALLALLHRLGVDPDRRRAERPVVFVGDLVDRGPDSVGVVELVSHLVDAGLAHAVLGNHELNLLRDDRKEGNGWYWGQDDHAQLEEGTHRFASRLATPAEHDRVQSFARELPLALERDDLRVVHAGWDPEAAALLPTHGEHTALHEHFAEAILVGLDARGIPALAAAERAEFAGLRARDVRPDRHLAAVAEEDAAFQLGNPVKLLTSGAEVPVPPGEHFFVNGKWRFVSRDRWWRRPVDRPTVVGHYWRRRETSIAGKPDVWDDVPPYAWAGQVFCVDYSVGRRYAERARGGKLPFAGGLAALRWPERELLFDDQAAPIATQR